MSRQLADDEVLLAVAVSLALAQGKSANELGVLAGFVSVVGSILALLAVALAAEESAAAEKKAKETEEKLEARLKEIEERLAACCEGMGEK